MYNLYTENHGLQRGLDLWKKNIAVKIVVAI